MDILDTMQTGVKLIHTSDRKFWTYSRFWIFVTAEEQVDHIYFSHPDEDHNDCFEKQILFQAEDDVWCP